MKSPVAKFMNTFNKSSLIPHKKRNKLESAELRDAEETLCNELVDGLKLKCKDEEE